MSTKRSATEYQHPILLDRIDFVLSHEIYHYGTYILAYIYTSMYNLLYMYI